MIALVAATSIIASLALAAPLAAQNGYRGYLGVYVRPDDDGGMAITGFINSTPAARLNKQGEIKKGDVIVKLAGKEIHTLNGLRRARDTIPFGSDGKLVLRGRDGDYYYVWISRKNPSNHLYVEGPNHSRSSSGTRGYGSSKGGGRKATGGATGSRATGGAMPRSSESADEIHPGGKGRGDDQKDIRASGE